MPTVITVILRCCINLNNDIFPNPRLIESGLIYDLRGQIASADDDFIIFGAHRQRQSKNAGEEKDGFFHRGRVSFLPSSALAFAFAKMENMFILSGLCQYDDKALTRFSGGDDGRKVFFPLALNGKSG